MNLSFLIVLVLIIGLLRAIYHKKFLLSILLRLELMMLNIIVFNIYIGILNSTPYFTAYSVFILALSAVEASIGISLISILSRKFSEVRVITLRTLKK